jgi:hypothetical protein
MIAPPSFTRRSAIKTSGYWAVVDFAYSTTRLQSNRSARSTTLTEVK